MTVSYEDMREAIGTNWYLVDPNLRFLIERYVAPEDREWAEDRLRQMGELMGGTVARNAEVTDGNPPRLVRWDRDGNETNEVVHHATALETKRLLWKNGFLHLRWSDEVTERGRPVPGALLMAHQYLLSQAETGMLCSVGMTTGVLRLIERYGDEETKQLFVPRLLEQDFDRGWDGSMYLTEHAGGSDLGRTETTARQVDGEWRLDGLKWFCSNVDGDAIVTLARPAGAPEGIKGIALFAVPRRLPDGRINGLHIRRIKDKLGTRAVPTGEIDFVDAKAYLLAGGGEATDGRGINRMMEFVNESRLGVAAMGAGIMRRVFLDATIRAHQRVAFGRPIAGHGMVREQLLDLLADSEAASGMLFRLAHRLERETEAIGRSDAVARILVPLSKIRCTRGGIQSASLALELFGGNGYIEDWPMARQLRDAQCHTIWEGAENVLALDVLRTMARDRSHEALLRFFDECLEGVTSPLLEDTKAIVTRERGHLLESLGRIASADREIAMLHAGKLANDMADVAQATLLVADAQHELDERGSARKAVVAAWYVRRRLEPRGAWHPGNEGVAMELFDRVIRYEVIEPDEAREQASL